MKKAIASVCLLGLSLLPLWLRAQTETVVVRPIESDEVLVNPGMGITTFQRFNGDPLNPGLEWSEEGPLARFAPASSKPDFPQTSIAYCRWFWTAIEPERGHLLRRLLGRRLERLHARFSFSKSPDRRLAGSLQAHSLADEL